MNAIVTVPFRGDQITCVETPDGVFVAAKPICERFGLAWAPQHRRFATDPGRWGITNMVTPSAGGEQESTCLPLSRVAAWLFVINAKKVRPELREALTAYQTEAAEVLDRHFRQRLSSAETELAQRRAQLADLHEVILSMSPRWNKIVRLMRAGCSKAVVWRRTRLSWGEFRDELLEMERMGLISEADWYSGPPQTSTEQIEALEDRLAQERQRREQAEARIRLMAETEAES